MNAQRVVVVGGGIVGLSSADELVRAGHDVLVCDPTPGCGATRAAAGMLAPAGEAWFGEEPLVRLGLDSLARWPRFAAHLEERTGMDVGLRSTGSLMVGMDRDDVTAATRSRTLLEEVGVRVEQLGRAEIRRREPGISSRIAGGAWLPDDHQVDPRRAAAALLAALGDRVIRQRATPVRDGVQLDDGRLLPADVVVIATGADGQPPVRPVRGEIIRVRSDDVPTHVVRARVHGQHVYIVPRTSGEIVIGATEEEHAGPPLPTMGGTARLLEAARILMPSLELAEFVEVIARNRPGSPDNGPLIGEVEASGPRRIVARGHYRGGVLLSPVTAAAVRALVEQTPLPEVAEPFDPGRFNTGRFNTGTFNTGRPEKENPCT